MNGSVLPDSCGAVGEGGPREACGVFAVHGHPEAAKLCFFGLYALQHRGQESAGIVAVDDGRVSEHRQMGLVSEVFDEKVLEALPGSVALGHTRYSTTGVSLLKNAQPFLVQFGGHLIAVAHNGNLTNARTLRSRLEGDGSIFQSTMDTEIFIHLLARHLKDGLEEALLKALPQAQGAYSLGLLYKDTLVGARDPNGFRPLCIGRLNGAYFLSSETCALDLVGAEFVREVEPGEIVIIDRDGLRSLKMNAAVSPTFCIFEYIYFARPDSMIFGETVYDMRQRMGARLAQEYPNIQADLVMPFPDSGNYAALGYSKASGIPFEIAMIRNHYVGRTFIQPSQSMRDFSVKVKLNPVRSVIRGKRVAIIEDSIIRGTTSRTRIKAIREAGAKDIHMLVSCPPHRFPCFYGIDFSTKGELVAARHNVQWLTKFLGLDSLGYLSLDGLVASTGFEKPMFCKACFDGKYPVPVEDGASKFSLEADEPANEDRG
jgi:amidophosphoribosyltransferase